MIAEMTTVAGFFALIAGSIIAVILVALLLSGVLTKPLKELQSSAAAAENLIRLCVRTYDEIGQLGRPLIRCFPRSGS